VSPVTIHHKVISFDVSMLTTVLFALILIAPTMAVGQEVQVVSVYDGHVTFEIPSDWEEIPPEVLESHSMRLAEASGGRLTDSYRRFLRLPTTEDMRNTGRETIDERAGPAVRDMELRDAVFDRKSFSLHLRNTLVLSLEGKTSVKSVAFLTERGLFTMHFYSRVRATEEMEEISARIVDSVRFDDELRYRPRLLDRWPPGPATILVVVGVLIAIAALAAHFLQRRRSLS
jgi:hypothetical protein